MFTKSVTPDDATKRLNAITTGCLNSGYYMFQFAKITSGQVDDSQHCQFNGKPGTIRLRQGLTLETQPIVDFMTRFGRNGNNTLLIFNGCDRQDVVSVWAVVGQTIEYEAIDIAVLASEHGMFDPNYREHLYFIGFPNIGQKQLFIMGYAGQSSDMILQPSKV